MLPSLQADQLVKCYGQQRALSGISFSLLPGQITGLTGPNGAGKSTLLKILSGSLLPSSGTAVICGCDVSTSPEQVRALVGYLPENNPLYPDMYVEEFLLFAARMLGLGRRSAGRVKECVEMVQLGPEKRKLLGVLSKGYRQRVGLAQALLHDPKVLILDEPATGLDPNQLEEVRNLIREVGKTRTVLLSTHILQEVEAICHRILLLKGGVLVADESVSDFASRALSGQQRVLVEFDRPVERAKLLMLAGVEQVIEQSATVMVVSGSGEADLRPILFRFAVDEGLTLLSVRQPDDYMESVFRGLTGHGTL